MSGSESNQRPTIILPHGSLGSGAQGAAPSRHISAFGDHSQAQINAGGSTGQRWRVSSLSSTLAVPLGPAKA
jgi:hypothetical protein